MHVPTDATEPKDAPALPADFLFGVASTALSVEGAADSLSVWDVFAAGGRTADGSGPGAGADARGHLAEDVGLLRELGVGAYRFSVSWPRILPEGGGAPDPIGLGFYDELVDRLLAAGIEPWATLYHWDLPISLMLDGGWLDRDTAARFGDYAAAVAGRLGDRVAAWTTISDPFDHSFYGHAVGIDAPGLALYGGAFAASHHLLLGHAAAVEALRAIAGGRVGVQVQHSEVVPNTDHDDDVAAAASFDALFNRQFAGPILAGEYPERIDELVGTDLSVVVDGDLPAIAMPLDFYGVSYAHPLRIAAAPDNQAIGFTMVADAGLPHTPAGLPVRPASLTATLASLAADYRLPPVYVTTGVDQDDNRHDDHDDDGVSEEHLLEGHGHEHLATHLAAIGDAVDAGVGVRGHFARALLDGWEFGDGRTRRYGLVAVDRDTHRRTPRPVFRRYAELIRRNRDR